MSREIIEEIKSFLESQEEVRGKILDVSHRAIRKSSSAMTALHRNDFEEVKEILSEAREDIETLNEILDSEPQFSDYGALLAAHREYAEVNLTMAFIRGEEPGSPEDLGVLKKAYVQALAESVGELRRHTLDLLRGDKVSEASEIYDKMEEIFDELTEFDFPDSILSGFRHRRDVARRSLEKTRGDLTNAVRQKNLEASLEEVERKLED
ncbi:MAG: hypothetical protein KGY45_02145 [Hadesarchaea archaeon]|nr:hypothetical protein [Hadesarchaea archaeon]